MLERFLRKNVHDVERVARVAFGVGLLTLAFRGRTRLGWLGVVPVATGLSGRCPGYALFGIDTRRIHLRRA